MSRVAALLVTHDSRRWIEATLAAVRDQSRPPERIVIVDDGSTDGTPAIIADLVGQHATVLPSTAGRLDRISRIAHNFQQGLRACADVDVVVLGDHDDVWLPTRVAHQVAVLERSSKASMVASDGRIVDEDGLPTGGRLRDAFPVPAGFDTLPADARMRIALRHMIATGGASAVRPAAFTGLGIPPGWLHDRWWSLVATSREAMLVDDTVVIDYRVSAHQEVGLDPGNLHRSPLSRVGVALGSVGPSLAKLRDIRRDLAPLATTATRPELSGLRLVRNLL